MNILRILNVEVINSANIAITFTANLTLNLTSSNCVIQPLNTSVPNPNILSVDVKGSILKIICQPLTSLESYYLIFKSVTNFPFISVNVDAKISEDGVSNQYLILGPAEEENVIKNYLESYLRDNIYNIDDKTTAVSKYVRSLSDNLSRALYDIRQVKNENYISTDIIDERKLRGVGPFDRLNEESAYEVVRVGITQSNTFVSNTLSITQAPAYPITLQRQPGSDTLTSTSLDGSNTFNINSLVLSLSNFPVTKINSITFTLSTATPVYVYNIANLGYQILDSRYDKDYGFTYNLLSNNQIKLNSSILSDPLFAINKILKVDVKYEYKNLGIIIDDLSILVFTSKQIIREVLPPIINVFALKNAPIIDAGGKVPTVNGVTFSDPNNVVGTSHPAFTNEITFRFNALPNIIGQYAIDYATGNVYVYGASALNDGTGPFPPLATYNYKFIYNNNQDYTYDSGFRDIVALPNGNLLNNAASIQFNYEYTLIPGIDYNADVHSEKLNERVNSNLLALNALKVNNFPITNVFKIFNETSGEIYSLDRWNKDKIYFRYNTPPSIKNTVYEKTSFLNISNELLFVDTILSNSNSYIIFKISLKNNSLISGTEDCFGSSINTAVVFSNNSVFKNELWYDNDLSALTNYNKLVTNQYCIDYSNGIVYCAVSSTQSNDIGFITYKINSIAPEFTHIVSVDDIYYRIDPSQNKNKHFDYIKFSEASVLINSIESSDEKYLNKNTIYPYTFFNGKAGVFINSIFSNQLSSQIKSVRNIFEFTDLTNNISPLNFANASSSSGATLTVNPINKQTFDNVKFDGTNYYVTIPENIQYISPNISYVFSIVRVSDNAILWNSFGTIVTGIAVNLILPEINSPVINDLVNITYSFTINNLSRLVIDYNKGDLFIDYSYVADEILVSYEYGDNQLDFRQNNNLPAGSEYFVTYKVGALRDALLRNFGNLINIQELTNFNVDFPRERYRDAVTAALTSFIKGPTLTAINNIINTISHIKPQITESVFQNWSLGSSILYPEPISTTGAFKLLPAKFGNGALINDTSQSIKLPSASTIRLEEGTFETWVSPQWNGIDNDADLKITILKNGYNFDPSKIFVGAAEYHPAFVNNQITVNKSLILPGLPNMNKDGVFIYYDDDNSKTFKRWFIDVIDGYVSPDNSIYKVIVNSNGLFYDVKSVLPKLSNVSITTKTTDITFSISNNGITDGYINEGITFVSDLNHYLLDSAQTDSKNRFSLYKDISGYIIFKVYDKNKNQYMVSADISKWKANDLHHVAISWKLNTLSNQDEIHLFIDGLETPNIVNFNKKLAPYLHEKFRTINLEEIIYISTNDIVGSNDLSTTSGSNLVKSSINFSAYSMAVGNTIFIDEVGFDPAGYIINVINGQQLTLNSVMPKTLPNARFSVNKINLTISSDIDIAPKTAFTVTHTFLSGSDATIVNGSNIIISASKNFAALNVLPGDSVSILGILYTIISVTGNSLTILDKLTFNSTATQFYIYKNNNEIELPGISAVTPFYSITKDVNFNNILTVSNGVLSGDLLLIKTFGINHKKVKARHYIWGDGYENVIRTKLSTPISLDETKVVKSLLQSTVINLNNSTLVSGTLTSNNLITSQPSNKISGRSLAVNISGNNVDFTTPTNIIINGFNGITALNEIIAFNSYGTLYSVNLFTSINYINVVTNPIASSKVALTINAKEQYSITRGELLDGYSAIIRYAYPINQGFTLNQQSPTSVIDNNNLFSSLNINNYLYISSPIPAVGYYKINGISADRKSITLNSANLPVFTDGYYQIFNVSDYRSGFQNGYFTFESKVSPAQPYFLNSGFYEFDYSTYISAKFDPTNSYVYIGSDFNKLNQFNGIINSVKIYSIMLNDTRVGENIPSNQRSITKDFNSVKPLLKDSNTLALITFNDINFINTADTFTNTNLKSHFQTSLVVNSNFKNSLVITDNPIQLQNTGILDTKKSGTIEFWTSPIFDSGNDPNIKYYFDANSSIIENSVSINNASVKISSPASSILSVKMQGDNTTDYFAGGTLEIDAQRAIQEQIVNLNTSSVTVSNPILQVISVKIVGDSSNVDYFNNGSISSDKLTIYLGKSLPLPSQTLIITYQSTINANTILNTQIIRLNKKLPYENSNVVVTYVPKTSQGDRIAIYKDNFGYINFGITASKIDYIVRGPTEWSKGTWHRIKASYKFNSGTALDEIRLFLDGYQYSNITFGTNLIVGADNITLGSVIIGDTNSLTGNIQFKDQINTLFIGSEYNGASPMFGLIDNFRISNISRPIYSPYSEPLDINYSSNLSAVFPVTADLYTTYLIDYDNVRLKNTNFSILKNKLNGTFDFSVNIFDSFDIISNNATTKQTLEKLLNILKPAQGKIKINYLK